jgi:peptidoglycan hydrolase-like protein with peptidoglycan-binding domain
VDGVWGPDSQAGLERFQQSRGLQVSGQVNAATASMLGLDPMALVGPAPAPGAAEPLNQAVIRNVQQRLRALGHYRGAADGVWGPGTQRALERFQQGRGLQASGQMNPATAQALGLDPNNLEAPVRAR